MMLLPGAVQNLAHQLRVAAHTAAAQIDALAEDNTPEQRADLRQFVSIVAEAADTLFPVCSTAAAEPAGNVVQLMRACR